MGSAAAEPTVGRAAIALECIMIKRIASFIVAAGSVCLIIAVAPRLMSVEEAFATARSALSSEGPAPQPWARRSCDDLEYWFLSGACSKARPKHAARTKRHVASYQAGHAASTDLAPAKR
jgi:hypothetical protein